MGTSADLFGARVKLSSLQKDPPEVANEQELLAAVVSKVGPFADTAKLIYHIRISAGKVHWAVNSYFRSTLAAPLPPREDFDSRRKQSWVQSPADVAASPAAADPDGVLCNNATQAVTANQSDSIQQQQESNTKQHLRDSSHTQDLTATADDGLSSSSVPTQAAVCNTCSGIGLTSLPSNALELMLSRLDLFSLLAAASSCKTLYKAAQSDRIWQQMFKTRWGPVIFPTMKQPLGGSNSTRGQQSQPSHGASRSSTTAFAQPGAGESPASAGEPGQPAVSAMQVTLDQQPGGHPAAAVADAAASRHLCSSSSSSRFVSCWTGSSLPASEASLGPAAQATQTKQPAAATARDVKHNAISSHIITSALVQDAPYAASFDSSGCAVMAVQPPAGSWRLQYKQQYSYQAVRRCPKCGEATVLPVVYGFPSGPLLAGMHGKRLLLGGDHLIESCHVWACSGCRSCYRFYPYGDVQLWWQDDEAQQRLDHARAAASRCSRRAAPTGPEGVAGAAHGGGGGAGGGEVAHEDGQGDVAGLPRYTYEL